MSKINTTLIFISSILSIFCSPLIKDIFEIPKVTMEIYASIKRNQNFTVRLKSNHLIGNEWKLMNKDEANLRHVHPVNLIGNKNTVPFHKLDNYPERRLDDGYYDFQFYTSENLHHDISLDLHNSDCEDIISTEYEDKFSSNNYPIYYVKCFSRNV